MTVYVLQKSGGEYDDCWEETVAVITSEPIARLWETLEEENCVAEFDLDDFDLLASLRKRSKAYRLAEEGLKKINDERRDKTSVE